MNNAVTFDPSKYQIRPDLSLPNRTIHYLANRKSFCSFFPPVIGGTFIGGGLSALGKTVLERTGHHFSQDTNSMFLTSVVGLLTVSVFSAYAQSLKTPEVAFSYESVLKIVLGISIPILGLYIGSLEMGTHNFLELLTSSYVGAGVIGAGIISLTLVLFAIELMVSCCCPSCFHTDRSSVDSEQQLSSLIAKLILFSNQEIVEGRETSSHVNPIHLQKSEAQNSAPVTNILTLQNNV